MQQRRGASRIVPVVVVLAVAAGALNVLAQAAWAAVEPYLGFIDHVIPAAVGIAFAALAIVAAVFRWTRVAVLGLTAAFAQSAEPLATGLQQITSLWLLIASAASAVSVVAVWLVVADVRGRLRGSLPLVATGSAILVGIVQAVSLGVLADPAAWGWCACQPSPWAIPVDADAFLALRRIIAIGWAVAGAAMIAACVAAATRRLAGRGATDTLVAVAGALLGSAWIVQGVLAVTSFAGGSHAADVVEQVALVAVASTLAARLFARRVSTARVADLLARVGEGPSPLALQRELARGLGDPHLALLLPADGGFADASGVLHADAEEFARGRGILAVGDRSHPDALLVLDPTLDTDPALLAAVAQALRLWSENARLTAELGESLVQVRESRARIVTAADDTRRRIERDLHDGTQQFIVSAGMSLSQASAHAADDPHLVRLLGDTADRLDRALAELRELASGIAPTALAHGTLADALRELALRSPVPASVEVSGDADAAGASRSTVYFVVAEALTNVAKHSGASSAQVRLTIDRGGVVVDVRDDGAGGADLAKGTGLRGLADRVEALGGRLTVESGPDGTQVRASIPAEEGQ